MKTEEKLAVAVLLGAVVCWMLPGIPFDVLPEVKDYIHRMGYAVPALAGASLLCVIQVRKRSISSFRTWMVEGVEWGSVSLCAAIMAIGKVIGNPDTGIPELMTTVFLPLAQAMPFYALLFISILWVVLQTNLMSNIVSGTLVYTIMVPIVVAMGVGNPIAMGVTLAAASYYAFSLPSATGSTAVVVGSGWVPVPFMARYGFALVIPIALMFTFVCYPIAAVVFS
jgi:sodium-dependent dicarboxylate transporter 2/3/5